MKPSRCISPSQRCTGALQPLRISETQKLAKEIKLFSGLTNAGIEEKLEAAGVTFKDGSRFSTWLNGKASKAHGLTGFRKAAERAGLLPTHEHLSRYSAHPELRTTAEVRTERKTDWAAEDRKAKAFYKSRERARIALLELANSMDDPGGVFFFDLLRNWYIQQGQRCQAEIEAEVMGPIVGAAEEMRELANWIGEMGFSTASGWSYSDPTVDLKSGAKVVQSRVKMKNEIEKRRKSKIAKPA